MPVSLTTPGWSGARNNASAHVAFRETDNVGTRNFQAFAAQWLAYALPYRRFDGSLEDAVARLGADAVGYTFIVADFHHLLLAGFADAPVGLMMMHGRVMTPGLLMMLTSRTLWGLAAISSQPWRK
jgi:hypothetical protein